MKATLAVINQMQDEGVIGSYAIGGAVGATFYIEPSATLDIDIFITLGSSGAGPLISLSPIYDYLKSRGYTADKEYILIEGWPVQFLPPTGTLGDEALAQAVWSDVDGTRARVMTAEHLVAIALQTGRAKDFSRILQFIEAGVLDAAKLDGILACHGLVEKWEAFGCRFLGGTP